MTLDEQNQEWILDSGCFYHMTSHKAWFKTYREIDVENVYLGNGESCTVMGIGEVVVKMYNGVVRVLTGVRHISALSKNLISLSTLHMSGFHYETKNDNMLVCKGNDIVIKGMLRNRLYYMRGTIVVQNHSCSHIIQEDNTQLRDKMLAQKEINFLVFLLLLTMLQV